MIMIFYHISAQLRFLASTKHSACTVTRLETQQLRGAKKSTIEEQQTYTQFCSVRSVEPVPTWKGSRSCLVC